MPTRFLLSAFALALALPAGAADPCAEDQETFCSDATDVTACMTSHGPELSEACRAAWGKGRKGAAGKASKPGKKPRGGAKGEKSPSMTACAPDLVKFCSKVKPGGGRLVDCLHANEGKLSKACKRAHSEHYRKIELAEGAKEKCAGDAEDLCADVTPGTGRLARCLKDHLDELSKPCTKIVKSGRDRLENQMATQVSGKGAGASPAKAASKPGGESAEAY